MGSMAHAPHEPQGLMGLMALMGPMGTMSLMALMGPMEPQTLLLVLRACSRWIFVFTFWVFGLAGMSQAGFCLQFLDLWPFQGPGPSLGLPWD